MAHSEPRSKRVCAAASIKLVCCTRRTIGLIQGQSVMFWSGKLVEVVVASSQADDTQADIDLEALWRRQV